MKKRIAFLVAMAATFLVVLITIDIRMGVNASVVTHNDAQWYSLFTRSTLLTAVLSALFWILLIRKPRDLFMVLAVLASFLMVTSFGGFLKSAENYEKINIATPADTDQLVAVNWTEVEQLVAGTEPAIIYIGRPNCPYCAEFAPKLNQLVKETSETVYYYDVYDVRTNDPDAYEQQMKGLGVNGVPTVLEVSNGDVTENISGDDIYEETEELIQSKQE